MGDDDKMEVNYLSEFNNLISNYPDLDVYHCRVKIINENTDLIRLTPICSVYENTSKYILNCIQGINEQFISDFVYRKINLVNNGGFFKLPLAWASDYTTSYIASGNKGIAYTPIPILCYRQNQFNITSTGSFELKRLAIIGHDNWVSSYLNQLNNNDPSLYILKKSFYKLFKLHKIAFIQMMIGRSWKSIFICIKKRNEFKISLTNIFEAVFISIFDKL
jgi:hypothetical protein